MTKRPCLTSGCPALVQSGRCGPCARKHDAARGTRQQRGYDKAHDQLRADYQRRMNAGETFTCWRCRLTGVVTPIDPGHWHLGHDDLDRTRYRGPECPPCNQATNGRECR